MKRLRIIKKYSNRRLYDTTASAYITLDELSEIIRGGEDVQVVDAKSGDDLTQATLAQIVIESGAARLLPAPLLTQMIRMEDDALAEFMQLYVAWAFDIYSEVKRGVGKLPGLGPIANFDSEGALGRLLGLNPFFRAARNVQNVQNMRAKLSKFPDSQDDEEEDHEVAPAGGPGNSEVKELRKELDEMKELIRELAAGKRT